MITERGARYRGSIQHGARVCSASNLLTQPCYEIAFYVFKLMSLRQFLLIATEMALNMTAEDNPEESDANPIAKAWRRLKSDINTQQIQEVINIEDGRPKIDPAKAKQLAQNQNPRAIQGATGGAIVGAVISISGALTIPLAAAGAALGYAMDNSKIDQVEDLEEDFEEILEAIEDEEQVDLSRLAIITHVKKETLSTDYLPYLEDQGLIDYDEEAERVKYSESIIQQAGSYIGR